MYSKPKDSIVDFPQYRDSISNPAFLSSVIGVDVYSIPVERDAVRYQLASYLWLYAVSHVFSVWFIEVDVGVGVGVSVEVEVRTGRVCIIKLFFSHKRIKRED